jgi:hypothetical protein
MNKERLTELAIHAERWSANCGGELKFGLSLCPIHKVQEMQKVSFFSASRRVRAILYQPSF